MCLTKWFNESPITITISTYQGSSVQSTVSYVYEGTKQSARYPMLSLECSASGARMQVTQSGKAWHWL